MKPLVCVYLFFCTAGSFAQSIVDYQWKNRLIILVGDKTDTSLLQDQLSLLEANKDQLNDRDLLILEKPVTSLELKSLSLNPEFRGLLLIGKDGGIKLMKPFLVSPQAIFDLVDAMPMRQAEIRNQRHH